ncbi:hypothetical protein M8J77_001805 [Diaphorina citri]|nr:hypothetical protein M8J77_001805 [Diaphorina citri]
MCRIWFSLALTALLCTTSQGARILVFIPLFNPSHYMQYEPLFEALAARGHHITLYSPHTLGQNLTNFKHVYLKNQAFSESAKIFNPLKKEETYVIFRINPKVPSSTKVNREIISEPHFNNLIRSGRGSFDIVLAEPLFGQEATVYLGHALGVPLINLGASAAHADILDVMGSPNIVSHMPEFYSSLTDRMNFIERAINFIYAIHRYYLRLWTYWEVDHMIAAQFGANVLPSVESLLRNISLSFVCTDVGLEYPRAQSGNIVPIGGIHIERNGNLSLPEDIQKTLDSASQGFILYSLGSIMKSETAPDTLARTLVETFSKFENYKIIWIWNGQQVTELPSHVVQIKQWVPQIPILAHPNCKLFITHGGLKSQIEAVHFGVPMVIIPYFYDQFQNAAKAVEFGLGIELSNKNLTVESLEWAIRSVLHDSRYKKQAMARSRILKDRLRSPLDTAVYWTEYVLQHEGALHLSPVSRHLYWFQYYLLDVMAFILAVGVVAVLLMRRMVRNLLGKRVNVGKEETKMGIGKND